MFRIIAKQDYIDKRPELIEDYNKGKKIKYNNEGNAEIKEKDIYYINDNIRASEIKESGLAEVEEIKEETKPKELEKLKTTNSKETKKTVKRTRKKKGE